MPDNATYLGTSLVGLNLTILPYGLVNLGMRLRHCGQILKIVPTHHKYTLVIPDREVCTIRRILHSAGFSTMVYEFT